MLSEWPEEMREQAACRGVDSDVFFPPDTHGRARQAYREARSICHGCPVKSECLEWALDNDQRFGMWGGKTPAERERIQRQRGQQ